MRFARLREEDGSCQVSICDLCGGELYRGERYYRINGEVICRDCLAAYARQFFAPFACGEEDTW